jgi:hypothetical protein
MRRQSVTISSMNRRRFQAGELERLYSLDDDATTAT